MYLHVHVHVHVCAQRDLSTHTLTYACTLYISGIMVLSMCVVMYFIPVIVQGCYRAWKVWESVCVV